MTFESPMPGSRLVASGPKSIRPFIARELSRAKGAGEPYAALTARFSSLANVAVGSTLVAMAP